jgi:hypothetical protein
MVRGEHGRWVVISLDGREDCEFGQPVFVLCNARSGSTLLRFVLDTHPDLACPPETNVPAMAAQLATVWSLIEGAPLAAERGDEPPQIPEAAIAGVRRTLGEMTESYLRRRGKRRYCDKSLGTARWAELLVRVFPGAKFLCLYRHPMDVAASGIEACPWGLQGYGFDPYVAASPGNALLALSRFWIDNASTILAVEEKFPAYCARIRYEDLVADPEQVADSIFDFLGVAPQPGISQRCFSVDRERFGPADYKIWHTSHIRAGSVGRGWTLPAGMIPPQLRQAMNELTSKLGYLPVDDSWGTTEGPADLRLTPDGATNGAATPQPLGEATAVADRLRHGVSRLDGLLVGRLAPCAAESFGVIATPAPGTRSASAARWRVNLASRQVHDITGHNQVSDTDWDVIATVDVWQALLESRTNLGVALRHCGLRYCDSNEDRPGSADNRLAVLAALLSLDSVETAPTVAGP